MATIVIPHRGSNQTSQTTPVGDTITVGDTRVRNASQALAVQPSPSWAGSVSGRNWNSYFIEGLTGPCQGLYSGIPVVFQNPSTDALFVEYVYNHNGNTSELALAGVIARNVFEGQRGDTFVSPYITAVPTPRADPDDPTLWTAIDLGGWLFHITATGRTITNCGKALPAGVFPTLDGARKTLNGTFPDGYFNGPNDLCFDPGNPLIIYVADTFNDRIARVEETSPGVVEVTTYYSGGLTDPYSLYPEADGTLIVADRGNNRVIRIPQVGGPGGTAGTPVNIATGLNLPMVVRKFSDGNICCVEHGGTRRVLEITRANGNLREITTIRTQQGVTGTAWLWMDVDDHGTMGPVDDIFTVLSSSFDTLRRTGRTDGFGTTDLNEGFVVNGSALTQGMLNQVQDAQGHYPWAVAVSDTEAKLLLTGSGSQQVRQMRRTAAGDVTTALTSTQKSRRERGGRIWGGINFDMTKPSYTLTAGFAGGHNLFGAPNENTETIDAMSWADKAAFLRGGGNGIVPRTLTDVDVQDIAYYIKMNARRGLRDSSIDVVGHAAPVTPGVPPDPPPSPPVVRRVAATVSFSLEEIVDDPPDPPVPDPELPPPGDGDTDPGEWRMLAVSSRTVYQPRMAGSQSIAEGDPGCAINVSPNPVSATGTIFRSFSGMAAGAGRVWSIGGGHLGHPGNDVDILNLNTMRWNLPFQAELPDPYIAGVPNSIWRGIRGGGIATGGFSPTVRPWVHHAYRLMCVDTTRDRLMFMSGNGLGCYDPDGTWTQLSGRSSALNEPVCNSTGAPMYDPERDSLWVFAGDTVNGLTRGIFEYNIAADTWRRVSNWPAIAGWSFASKYIQACYVPATREAFLICGPNSTWPEFPFRVFRYQLDTGSLTWEETLKGGASGNGGLAYEELFHDDNRWGRRVDFRTRTNQLYFYTSAWETTSRTVEAGFWIFTPAAGSGGTWAKLLTPNGPSIAWWTLCYDRTTDLFAGLRARTTYCGVAGSSCGGIADTHIFDPSV